MIRLLLSIPLGLSLLSCDKPSVNGVAEKSDSPIHDLRFSRPRAEVFDRRSLGSVATDPVEALRGSLDVAVAIQSADERDKALADVVWNAMEIDPETAHAAFHQLSENHPEKLRLIRHYAMRIAAENPEQAIEWASSFDSENEISAAMSHIALEVATQDPVRAANLLVDFGIEGRDLDVAVVQVVQRWAGSSPPDAIAWVEKFAAGNVREASLQAVFERWLAQDIPSAIQWAESIDDVTFRHETEIAIFTVLLQQPDATRAGWLQEDTSGYLKSICSAPN